MKCRRTKRPVSKTDYSPLSKGHHSYGVCRHKGPCRHVCQFRVGPGLWWWLLGWGDLCCLALVSPSSPYTTPRCSTMPGESLGLNGGAHFSLGGLRAEALGVHEGTLLLPGWPFLLMQRMAAPHPTTSWFSSEDLRRSCLRSTPTSGNLKANPGAEKQKESSSSAQQARENGAPNHRPTTAYQRERVGFASFLSRWVAAPGLQPTFLDHWTFS